MSKENPCAGGKIQSSSTHMYSTDGDDPQGVNTLWSAKHMSSYGFFSSFAFSSSSLLSSSFLSLFNRFSSFFSFFRRSFSYGQEKVLMTQLEAIVLRITEAQKHKL